MQSSQNTSVLKMKFRGKSAHLFPVFSGIVEIFRRAFPKCVVFIKTLYAVIEGEDHRTLGVIYFRSGYLDVGLPDLHGAKLSARLRPSSLSYPGISYQVAIHATDELDANFTNWIVRIARTGSRPSRASPA